MTGITIVSKEGNKFDKIVKENIESILPVLMTNVLDLEGPFREEVSDSIQHTTERKPDVVRKVKDEHNNTFLLHLEWQSGNDKDMVYRMAEYSVMLQRKYRLPVEQYVIYLGEGKVIW